MLHLLMHSIDKVNLRDHLLSIVAELKSKIKKIILKFIKWKVRFKIFKIKNIFKTFFLPTDPIFLISFLLINSVHSWNPLNILRSLYCESIKSYGNCDCYNTCSIYDENPVCVVSKASYNPENMTKTIKHASYFANFCFMENYECQHRIKYQIIELKFCLRL